jgi:TM2 domain-containing membrane protein YozV
MRLFAMSNCDPTVSTYSTANVIAAIASFLLPGLGQLAQGRPLPALLFFLAALALWCCCLGWVIQVWAALDAAWWRPSR